MLKEQLLKIVAISGSLRSQSVNTALLQAVEALAPDGVAFVFYAGLGELPHFNPDLDGDDPAAAVRDLRTQLQSADGVLICTPEYAKGVPGVLKNALDWVVSSGEFVHKPVAVISASPLPTGGEHALASLILTLGMMSATIVPGGTLQIPFVKQKLNADGMVTDPATEQALRSLLHALTQEIREGS